MPFRASDGTEFADRRSYNRYEFELSFTFRSKAGAPLEHTVLLKEPGSIDGQPFELENLIYCDVLLLDYTEAIQVDNLRNCRFLNSQFFLCRKSLEIIHLLLECL